MPSILIADSHYVVRKGLKQIIEEEIDNVKVLEIEDGNTLIKQVHSAQFDLIICELALKGKGGLEVLEYLKSNFPKLPVLIFSAYTEDHYAVRALKTGALGYISKDCSLTELSKAIKLLLSGRHYISESVAGKLAENLNFNNKEEHENLSNREFEVLKLIANGKSVSEIANIFSLSVNTISTYRARILEKTKLKHNAEITHYAILKNLI